MKQRVDAYMEANNLGTSEFLELAIQALLDKESAEETKEPAKRPLRAARRTVKAKDLNIPRA